MKNLLNKKTNWRPLAILVAIIIVLGATGFFVLTYGNKKTMPDITYNEDIFSKLKDAELYGKEMKLTTDDLNSLIKLAQIKNITKAGVNIKEAYAIVDKSRLTIYAKVHMKGLNLLVSSRNNINFLGDTIRIIPENVRVGLVPIPISIVMNRLSSFSRENLIITENEIDIEKKLLPIDIKAVSIKDKAVVVEIERDKEIAEMLKTIYKEQPTESSTTSKPEYSVSSPSKQLTINKNDSTKVKAAKRTKIINKAIAQLNAVTGTCNTPKQKTLVRMAQDVLKKMITNPNYDYMNDAGRLQSYFRSMSNNEMVKLKAAILGKVDTRALMQISSN